MLCIYIYIYPYHEFSPKEMCSSIEDHPPAFHLLREMGSAPRNPAPRSHFLVWIVKPSGCHCTDGHWKSRVFTEDQNIS